MLKQLSCKFITNIFLQKSVAGMYKDEGYTAGTQTRIFSQQRCLCK